MNDPLAEDEIARLRHRIAELEKFNVDLAQESHELQTLVTIAIGLLAPIHDCDQEVRDWLAAARQYMARFP